MLAALVGACGRLGFEDRAAPDDGAPGDADVPADAFVPGIGTWTALPPSGLSPRVWTSAVWTGSDFLVYGGATDAGYDPAGDGARFDPATNAWTPMGGGNAPAARHTARLALVGNTVVEYAGGVGFGATSGGGRYRVDTNVWSGMATSDPGARIYAAMTTAGGLAATYGGFDNSGNHLASGFLYDPITDSWTPMQDTGAPSARSFASMVWTGDRLIVWGGCAGGMPACAEIKGDGAAYDPAAKVWSPISTVGAPEARAQHAAVWTGTEMIVFGGCSKANEGGHLSSGAAYNPATDTWRVIKNGPPARVDPGAAWIGDRMVVWGSDNGATDGWLYDPVGDEWERMSAEGAPGPRARFAFAGTEEGSGMVFVWGGQFDEESGAVWRRE